MRYFAKLIMTGAPVHLRALVDNITKFCHSIFARSLARFAFRNPNGITYGYATFDLLLQNSPITKLKFCHSERSEESLISLMVSNACVLEKLSLNSHRYHK